MKRKLWSILITMLIAGIVFGLGQSAFATGVEITLQPVSGATGVGQTYTIYYATSSEYRAARLYEGTPNSDHTFVKRLLITTNGSDKVPASDTERTASFYIEFELTDGSYIYSDIFTVTWDASLFAIPVQPSGGSIDVGDPYPINYTTSFEYNYARLMEGLPYNTNHFVKMLSPDSNYVPAQDEPGSGTYFIEFSLSNGDVIYSNLFAVSWVYTSSHITKQPVGGRAGVGEEFAISYSTDFEYYNAGLYEGTPPSGVHRKVLEKDSDTVPAEDRAVTNTYYIQFSIRNQGIPVYSNTFDVTWDYAAYIVTTQPESGGVGVGENYPITYATNFEYEYAKLMQGDPNGDYVYVTTIGPDLDYVPYSRYQETKTYFIRFELANGQGIDSNPFTVTWDYSTYILTTPPVGGTIGVGQDFPITFVTNYNYLYAWLYEGTPEGEHTQIKMLNYQRDTVPAQSTETTKTYYIDFELRNNSDHLYSLPFTITWDYSEMIITTQPASGTVVIGNNFPISYETNFNYRSAELYQCVPGSDPVNVKTLEFAGLHSRYVEPENSPMTKTFFVGFVLSNDHIINSETFDVTWVLPTYTVTYKVVYGTWEDGTTADRTENVTSGESPAEVPTGMIAGEGYIGGAWNHNPFDAVISSDTVFIYSFEPIPTTPFGVYYYLNGKSSGGIMLTQHIMYGQTPERPSQIPYDEEWVFTGWYNEESCETEFDFSAPITHNTWVYAGWKTAYESGSCGENVNWTLNTQTGLMTIDGTGTMTDYTGYAVVPWFAFRESVKSIVIGNGVISIGKWSFGYLPALTDITIADSVTSIGDHAFYRNNALQGITIPDSVQTIGAYAFDSCSAMEYVHLGSGVTSLGTYTFYDCASVKWFNVDRNNTSYSTVDGVLFNKTRATLLYYPNGKTDTSYTVPDSVLMISTCAFLDNTTLETIHLNSKLKTCGSFAFMRCTALQSIIIPASVTGLTQNDFDGCTALTSVIIMNSTLTFGANNIFNGCSALTLYGYAGSSAETYAAENSIPFVSLSGQCGVDVTWIFDPITGRLAISGEGPMTDYSSSSVAWLGLRDRIITIVIEDSVSGIGDFAFYGCSRLTDISIPDTVSNLGDYTFVGCSSLNGLHIPAGVTTIGNGVFNGCSSLSQITIPDSVTSLEAYAFANCSGLEKIIIPQSTNNIANFAFYNCTGMTDVTILNENTEFDDGIFSGCSSCLIMHGWPGSTAQTYAETHGITYKPLETPKPVFFLPAALTTIQHEAFSGIGAKAVVIPKTVISISGNPFEGSNVEFIYGYADSAAKMLADSYGFIFITIDDAWMASH